VIGLGVVVALSLMLAPPFAEAQPQTGKIYRLGLLTTAATPYIDAFRQGSATWVMRKAERSRLNIKKHRATSVCRTLRNSS
jgi:hypothetical protein